MSMLFYAIRERELLLNINELIAGFRFFPSYIRIGGLREDLPRGFHEAVNAFLDRFPDEDRRVRGAADEERHLPPPHRGRRRHHAGGRATPWGLVGPIARAAGSDYDVRKYFPYSGYETYDFKVPDGDRGRRLRALPRARRGDARERQDLPSRRSSASRRPASGPATTRASCRRRRTRSTPRWKR